MRTPYLNNHLGGRWHAEAAAAATLTDPVTGEPLARTGGAAIDVAAGFGFARSHGRAALQAMGYGERAARLAQVVDVLKRHRTDYLAISQANSGTTAADSAIDVDGAMYTLATYARLGAGLDGAQALRDGHALGLAKDGSFQSQHVLAPVQGLALFINAFNFPAWGLWEKAAPALLSGVPVVVKPATVTAWLTHRMVRDVVEAGVLPPGALSIVCGSSAGLLDALAPFGRAVVHRLGRHRRADPLAPRRRARRRARQHRGRQPNAAVLGPDAKPGSAAFDLFVDELVRELRTKSGQRCTCIRRALVPLASLDAVAEAVSARLSALRVGNPRRPDVQMGSLVSREQLAGVHAGIEALAHQARIVHDGRAAALVDADPAVAACVGPTLLAARDADAAAAVHRLEVFGPVATLLGTRDSAHAVALAQRGEGSLVCSLFSADEGWLADTAVQLAPSHGRIHAVSPAVATSHTGHGNVMPQSVHGGPGRAGGGEELGGLRALRFYHRRSALQLPAGALAALVATSTVLAD